MPTPAIVAPIEFTMRLDDYRRLGGHMGAVQDIAALREVARRRSLLQHGDNPWPTAPVNYRW